MLNWCECMTLWWVQRWWIWTWIWTWLLLLIFLMLLVLLISLIFVVMMMFVVSLGTHDNVLKNAASMATARLSTIHIRCWLISFLIIVCNSPKQMMNKYEHKSTWIWVQGHWIKNVWYMWIRMLWFHCEWWRESLSLYKLTTMVQTCTKLVCVYWKILLKKFCYSVHKLLINIVAKNNNVYDRLEFEPVTLSVE